MKHGPAWIIFEQPRGDQPRRLLSILSPRRNAREVARFLEQLCVDRQGSLSERLQYKKSKQLFAFTPHVDGHVMHCGHDPIMVGIRAQETIQRDNLLEFRYRIITRRGDDPADVSWEERVQTLFVNE